MGVGAHPADEPSVPGVSRLHHDVAPIMLIGEGPLRTQSPGRGNFKPVEKQANSGYFRLRVKSSQFQILFARQRK
jgi:hypothetical protein